MEKNKNVNFGCLLSLLIAFSITFIIPLYFMYTNTQSNNKRYDFLFKSPIKEVKAVKVIYLSYSHSNEYGLEISEGVLNNEKIYYPMSKESHKNYDFFIVTFENNNSYLVSIPKILDAKAVFKNNNTYNKLSKRYHLSSI